VRLSDCGWCASPRVRACLRIRIRRCAQAHAHQASILACVRERVCVRACVSVRKRALACVRACGRRCRACVAPRVAAPVYMVCTRIGVRLESHADLQINARARVCVRESRACPSVRPEPHCIGPVPVGHGMHSSARARACAFVSASVCVLRRMQTATSMRARGCVSASHACVRLCVQHCTASVPSRPATANADSRTKIATGRRTRFRPSRSRRRRARAAPPPPPRARAQRRDGAASTCGTWSGGSRPRTKGDVRCRRVEVGMCVRSCARARVRAYI
jgi:hypothetical protein